MYCYSQNFAGDFSEYFIDVIQLQKIQFSLCFGTFHIYQYFFALLVALYHVAWHHALLSTKLSLKANELTPANCMLPRLLCCVLHTASQV